MNPKHHKLNKKLFGIINHTETIFFKTILVLEPMDVDEEIPESVDELLPTDATEEDDISSVVASVTVLPELTDDPPSLEAVDASEDDSVVVELPNEKSEDRIDDKVDSSVDDTTSVVDVSISVVVSVSLGVASESKVSFGGPASPS